MQELSQADPESETPEDKAKRRDLHMRSIEARIEQSRKGDAQVAEFIDALTAMVGSHTRDRFRESAADVVLLESFLDVNRRDASRSGSRQESASSRFRQATDFEELLEASQAPGGEIDEGRKTLASEEACQALDARISAARSDYRTKLLGIAKELHTLNRTAPESVLRSGQSSLARLLAIRERQARAGLDLIDAVGLVLSEAGLVRQSQEWLLRSWSESVPVVFNRVRWHEPIAEWSAGRSDLTDEQRRHITEEAATFEAELRRLQLEAARASVVAVVRGEFQPDSPLHRQFATKLAAIWRLNAAHARTVAAILAGSAAADAYAAAIGNQPLDADSRMPVLDAPTIDWLRNAGLLPSGRSTSGSQHQP